MTLPSEDLSKPCPKCVDGDHDGCLDPVCGCIAAHAGDEPMIAGFKRLKRSIHPERELWTKGGWDN